MADQHISVFLEFDKRDATKSEYIAYLEGLGVPLEDADDIYLAWIGV